YETSSPPPISDSDAPPLPAYQPNLVPSSLQLYAPLLTAIPSRAYPKMAKFLFACSDLPHLDFTSLQMMLLPKGRIDLVVGLCYPPPDSMGQGGSMDPNHPCVSATTSIPTTFLRSRGREQDADTLDKRMEENVLLFDVLPFVMPVSVRGKRTDPLKMAQQMVGGGDKLAKIQDKYFHALDAIVYEHNRLIDLKAEAEASATTTTSASSPPARRSVPVVAMGGVPHMLICAAAKRAGDNGSAFETLAPQAGRLPHPESVMATQKAPTAAVFMEMEEAAQFKVETRAMTAYGEDLAISADRLFDDTVLPLWGIKPCGMYKAIYDGCDGLQDLIFQLRAARTTNFWKKAAVDWNANWHKKGNTGELLWHEIWLAGYVEGVDTRGLPEMRAAAKKNSSKNWDALEAVVAARNEAAELEGDELLTARELLLAGGDSEANRALSVEAIKCKALQACGRGGKAGGKARFAKLQLACNAINVTLEEGGEPVTPTELLRAGGDSEANAAMTWRQMRGRIDEKPAKPQSGNYLGEHVGKSGGKKVSAATKSRAKTRMDDKKEEEYTWKCCCAVGKNVKSGADVLKHCKDMDREKPGKGGKCWNSLQQLEEDAWPGKIGSRWVRAKVGNV
ncbi:hypothetical protein TeGR_g3336, partial [Tetraparma gracilis]